MSARRKNCVLILLICFVSYFALSIKPTSASPWNRDVGALFILSRAEYFKAEGGPPIGPNGEITRFSRFETNDYAEFGLTGDFMIGGKIAYGLSRFSNGLVESAANGFSQAEAFAQYQIIRGPRQAVAVKLTGATPARFDAGLRDGLANDGADLAISALYGRTLFTSPLKVFTTLDAGYRRRFGDAADQLRGDLLIGAEPTRRWLVLAEAFSTLSLKNEDPGGADYDIVKLQGSAVWRFAKRWSLQAGVNEEIAGRNLLLGRTYFIGLWSEF